MKNLIVWGIQCTLDYKYRLGEALTRIVHDWADEENGILRQMRPTFRSIASHGLAFDRKDILHDIVKRTSDGKEGSLWTGFIRDEDVEPETVEVKFDDDEKIMRLPSSEIDVVQAIAPELEKARNRLEEKGYECHVELGGDPGIAATRGYFLTRGTTKSQLPQVRYLGLYPDSVREYVQSNYPELHEMVFDGSQEVDARPQTISLESSRKVILIYGPGRSLEYMTERGPVQFDKYLSRIGDRVRDFRDGNVVAAFPRMFPVNLASELVDELKNKYKELKIFIGTGSFKRGTDINKAFVEETYEGLLKKADIVSFNDDELHDLHTVIVAGGSYKDISLATKLKQLRLKAIKVCHSADGAILELCCDPEDVITSDLFREDPYGFLEGALQLSVDGATYALDSVDVGRTATESMVRTYSSSIQNRSTELFRTTFLKTVETLPGGLVAAYAPLVVHPLATLTGIGAMFDSLFLSFLMRD